MNNKKLKIYNEKVWDDKLELYKYQYKINVVYGKKSFKQKALIIFIYSLFITLIASKILIEEGMNPLFNFGIFLIVILLSILVEFSQESNEKEYNFNNKTFSSEEKAKLYIEGLDDE